MLIKLHKLKYLHIGGWTEIPFHQLPNNVIYLSGQFYHDDENEEDYDLNHLEFVSIVSVNNDLCKYTQHLPPSVTTISLNCEMKIEQFHECMNKLPSHVTSLQIVSNYIPSHLEIPSTIRRLDLVMFKEHFQSKKIT